MAGGTRSYEMARRLVDWGHEVHMITTDRNGRFDPKQKWHETEEAGIKVHWTPIPYSNKMFYGQRIKSFFAFSWRAARKATEIGGDIVFATSTPLTIAIPGVYASKRLKIPMVFEVRDLWPEVPIALGALKNPLTKSAARWLERFAYRNSSHIVALAPGMKEHIISKGYPEAKVTVIPNGADVDLFNVPEETGQALRRQYEWLGDRPLVVYAGTLGMVNGVEFLVDLAEKTFSTHPEVRFAVIGSGKEEQVIKEYAEKKQILGKNFFMIGQIPKDKVPVWLSAATFTCSLIIDKRENWEHAVTNKFFDSLAAGRPIVNNHPGWQTEIAIENDCGILLSRDPKEAAITLTKKLMDAQWIHTAGSNAFSLAAKKFNRELLAKELEVCLSKTQFTHGKKL